MRAVIAAAGTGGHINPGIAIANKIVEKEPDSEIIFIGTNRGLEKDLVPRAGYQLLPINAYGIKRSFSMQNLKNLYATYKSIGEAKRILEQFKPDIVIGTGGYICIPAALAAKKLNIPIILHESNAYPGVAVRMLKNKVNKILVGFGDARERLNNQKNVIITGNPIKIKKLDLSVEQKNKIKQGLNLSLDKPVVLAFGGSQGAQSINRSLTEIIVNKKNKDYQLVWATGQEQYDVIKQELKKLNINIEDIENVKLIPYIYNMEEVMNACDLVVSRSGAMTITEVATVGKPAIFVPYPFATENHQEYNARVLQGVGAAEIILDSELNSEILNNTIENIVSNKSKLEQMGKNTQRVVNENVEEKIYTQIKGALLKSIV